MRKKKKERKRTKRKKEKENPLIKEILSIKILSVPIA